MSASPDRASDAPTSGNRVDWFCHECGWEGQPLRVPDPACARCRSSFVEEISSDADDPRQFDQPDDEPFGFGRAAGGPGIHNEPMMIRFIGPGGSATQIAFGGGGGPFIFGPRQGGGGDGALGDGSGERHEARQRQPQGGPLQAFMSAFGWAAPQGEDQAQREPTEPANGQQEQSNASETSGRRNGQARMQQVPLRNLASFLGEAFGPPQAQEADHPRNNPFAEGHGANDDEEYDRGQQEQQRRAQQHPFAVFADGDNGPPLNHLFTLLNAFGVGLPLHGSRGDYVFGEANFQQILNDLMEQAQGRAGPQPAPDDMIEGLPKAKVTADMIDSPNFHPDCVVCQDSFAVDDEIITLPCKHAHIFHTDCIVPWLKNSGTCPTCRFALVPQPHHADGQPPPRSQEDIADAAATTAPDAPRSPRAGGSPEHQRTDDDDEALSARLPGGWPGLTSDAAEQSRQASRERERSQREHEELPMDELD
ncbi:hypothetical protein OIV83_000179 [Microbotryomycetes sp. JL201]|nr:hypothetical protein OIV83_000179 [Microbotryomycetes sp. JL201]